MPKTVIYKPVESATGSCLKFSDPSIDDLDKCTVDFSELFFPTSFNEEISKKLSGQYGNWIITTDTKNEINITFENFLTQINADRLQVDFKNPLSHISSVSGQNRSQCQLLGYFNLSRFCEYRAAAAATEIPGVVDVTISRPNSSQDKDKVDIVVSTESSIKSLQVKAREGKKGRTDSKVPTLRNVYSLSFSEIKQRIKDLIYN